jgi:hypothetical protein
MATLYIANTTKQNHVFVYRHREMSNPAMREIKRGQQIPISDITIEEARAIVKQHEKYGIMDAAELSRRRDFAGLVYSIDKPVDIDQMLASFELNDKDLAKEAQQRREVQAAAISDNVATQLHNLTGMDKENVRPKSLQLEVTEETDGTRSVASGVEVPADPLNVEQRKRSR